MAATFPHNGNNQARMIDHATDSIPNPNNRDAGSHAAITMAEVLLAGFFDREPFSFLTFLSDMK